MEKKIQVQMPEKIGRFKLVEELGKGAMSIVYKAFDPEINRTIAIKMLRGECAADSEYRFRFLQEAKAAGKLAHPNIVTIYDVGEAPAGPYIAMEYLKGRTLQEVIASKSPVSLREKILYGIQLAEALAYSHTSNVVHRDVKPGNVVLSEDGKSVRITDFGIAHIETANRKHHTQMGTIIGTPQYMSPEQVDGESVDGRSDLFSLGVILYQLITGEKPFAGETLTALLMEIVQKEPGSIREKAPGIPESLEKVVEKLMRKLPDQRFQDGMDVADALRRVLRELDEKQRHRSEASILPLRVKWTAVMATVVTAAMVLGSYLVYRTQVEAMTRLTLDSGSTLAEFIAIESAEAVLIQDWIAIESFVNEVKERRQISYLTILDHQGIVRGSSSAELVGSEAKTSLEMPSGRIGESVFYSESVHNDEKVFDFHVPIIFQQKTIGSIRLGLSQMSLIAAAELTLYTMLGLLVAVVLTVVVVAYLLVAGITLPIKLLRRAIVHATLENYNYRIEEKRNDELGQLFNDYNKMAIALSQRAEERAAAAIESAANQRSQNDTERSSDRSGIDATRKQSYDSTAVIARLQQRLSVPGEIDQSNQLCDEPTIVIQPRNCK